MIRYHLPFVAVLAATLQAGAVAAQTDPMRLAHLSAANQVGVMEYCMDKGWADQAAVDGQKQAVAALPASADPAGTQAAEATGRKGELMNNGSTLALSAMARQSNTTEQDLCARMASAAKTVAAQRATMPTMPGMPAMPNGTAMPSLPPGMTVPGMTVPGMTVPGMTVPGMPKSP